MAAWRGVVSGGLRLWRCPPLAPANACSLACGCSCPAALRCALKWFPRGCALRAALSAPHWGAPRVRRPWRRRICRALGAPLPWRAPCGGSTGGTLRARVSRAAARPLRASAPRAPPQRPRHGCRFAAPWRTSPPRGLGAPIRRALGAFAPLGGRCRQLLHSARAFTRIRFTSKFYLTSGMINATISSAQNGRCNLLCCSLKVLTQTKDTTFSQRRSSGILCFFIFSLITRQQARTT